MDINYKHMDHDAGHSIVLERQERISIKEQGSLFIKNTQTQVRELYRRSRERYKQQRTESVSREPVKAVAKRSSSLDETKILKTRLQVDALNNKIENEIERLKNFRDLFLNKEASRVMKQNSNLQSVQCKSTPWHQCFEANRACITKDESTVQAMATTKSRRKYGTSTRINDVKPRFRTLGVQLPPTIGHGDDIDQTEVSEVLQIKVGNNEEHLHRDEDIKNDEVRVSGGCTFGHGSNFQYPCSVYQSDFTYPSSSYCPMHISGCCCQAQDYSRGVCTCSNMPTREPFLPNLGYQYPMPAIPTSCNCQSWYFTPPAHARLATDLNTQELCRNWCTDLLMEQHKLESRDQSRRASAPLTKERRTGEKFGAKTASRAKSKLKESKSPARTSTQMLDRRIHDKLRDSGISDTSSLAQYKVQSHEKIMKVTLRKQLNRKLEKNTVKKANKNAEQMVTKSAREDQTDVEKKQMYQDYMKMYKKEHKKTADKDGSPENKRLYSNPTYTRIAEKKRDADSNVSPQSMSKRLSSQRSASPISHTEVDKYQKRNMPQNLSPSKQSSDAVPKQNKNDIYHFSRTGEPFQQQLHLSQENSDYSVPNHEDDRFMQEGSDYLTRRDSKGHSTDTHHNSKKSSDSDQRQLQEQQLYSQDDSSPNAPSHKTPDNYLQDAKNTEKSEPLDITYSQHRGDAPSRSDQLQQQGQQRYSQDRIIHGTPIRKEQRHDVESINKIDQEPEPVNDTYAHPKDILPSRSDQLQQEGQQRIIPGTPSRIEQRHDVGNINKFDQEPVPVNDTYAQPNDIIPSRSDQLQQLGQHHYSQDRIIQDSPIQKEQRYEDINKTDRGTEPVNDIRSDQLQQQDQQRYSQDRIIPVTPIHKEHRQDVADIEKADKWSQAVDKTSEEISSSTAIYKPEDYYSGQIKDRIHSYASDNVHPSQNTAQDREAQYAGSLRQQMNATSPCSDAFRSASSVCRTYSKRCVSVNQPKEDNSIIRREFENFSEQCVHTLSRTNNSNSRNIEHIETCQLQDPQMPLLYASQTLSTEARSDCYTVGSLIQNKQWHSKNIHKSSTMQYEEPMHIWNRSGIRDLVQSPPNLSQVAIQSSHEDLPQNAHQLGAQHDLRTNSERQGPKIGPYQAANSRNVYTAASIQPVSGTPSPTINEKVVQSDPMHRQSCILPMAQCMPTYVYSDDYIPNQPHLQEWCSTYERHSTPTRAPEHHVTYHQNIDHNCLSDDNGRNPVPLGYFKCYCPTPVSSTEYTSFPENSELVYTNGSVQTNLDIGSNINDSLSMKLPGQKMKHTSMAHINMNVGSRIYGEPTQTSEYHAASELPKHKTFVQSYSAPSIDRYSEAPPQYSYSFSRCHSNAPSSSIEYEKSVIPNSKTHENLQSEAQASIIHRNTQPLNLHSSKSYNSHNRQLLNSTWYDRSELEPLPMTCEAHSRTVKFRDESSNLVECCRSSINWNQAHIQRNHQQTTTIPKPNIDCMEEGRTPAYTSDEEFIETYRSSSSANTELTCRDSNYEGTSMTCDEARPNHEHHKLPPFKGCPCMYETYLHLAAISKAKNKDKRNKYYGQ